jgi:hypothetical protein
MNITQSKSWNDAVKEMAAESKRQADEALERFSREMVPNTLALPHLSGEQLLYIFGEYSNKPSGDQRMVIAYRQYADALRAEILRRLNK